MFHNIPPSGTHNLNVKLLLQQCNLKRNYFLFFKDERSILNFKRFFFSYSNIYQLKTLSKWGNKENINKLNENRQNIQNSLNEFNIRGPLISTTYQKKTIVTKKEYILNQANEFEEIKRNKNQRTNVKTNVKINEEEYTVARGQKKETNEMKTNEMKTNEMKTNVMKINKQNIQNEKTDTKEEEEEDKLQKLLLKRKPQRNLITITEEAIREIKKIIEKHNEESKVTDHVLKLFFITKGCNGLTHSLKFITKNKIMKNDEIIYDDEKKILLVIDSKCVLFVINTKLDFYRDELTERFVFVNPNITSVCPCGTSFHFSKENNDEDD